MNYNLKRKERRIAIMQQMIDELTEENDYLKSLLRTTDVESVTRQIDAANKMREEAVKCIELSKQTQKDYQKLYRKFESTKKNFERDLRKLAK